MPRRLSPVLLFVFFALLSPPTHADPKERYQWESAGSEGQIALFTSEVPDHEFEAVKGVLTLPFPAAPLYLALYDFQHYPQWYYHCDEVQVLGGPTSHAPIPVLPDGRFGEIRPGGPWTLYFRQRTPPLDDRWAILQCSYRAGPGNTLLVEFQSDGHYAFNAPEGLVRMRLRGQWLLRPVNATHTQVAPGFLVNPVLRDTVRETLAGLGRAAGVHLHAH